MTCWQVRKSEVSSQIKVFWIIPCEEGG